MPDPEITWNIVPGEHLTEVLQKMKIAPDGDFTHVAIPQEVLKAAEDVIEIADKIAEKGLIIPKPLRDEYKAARDTLELLRRNVVVNDPRSR
jgi:hypothetical protein